MNGLVGIRRKLGNYALGHGGHFEVAKAGKVLRVTVDFHVHEICGAMRFVDRLFKASGIRNNVTVVLGPARPIDGAMLAASVFLEFYRYACEHRGRFHVSPRLDRTTVLSSLEIFADFEVGEEAARDWLAETIWMFGLKATALPWRLLNERDRQCLLERSEVVGL
ncbi:hypothetical protein [Mesorhizobium sp. ZC-5]|uniref:hypothetical protein n=1 Tax=Mesorhizobium sp. ZC-5 TaxID=2986066 RepID=UPI0021E8EB8D|nr:hypothetical protein [Mesorhizobium sp. ZC-5]MCV3240643.1 hypothetical protein [Mesorhizobium sp. ZC-5]